MELRTEPPAAAITDGVGDDFIIGIDKGTSKFLGDAAANGGLPHSHHPDQHDVR